MRALRGNSWNSGAGATLQEALSARALLGCGERSKFADAHGRSASAAAAARVHAKLLEAPRASCLAAAATKFRGRRVRCEKAGRGLGAVDALYGEAPNDSLRAAASLRSCEDAASVKDVCALIRAAAAAGRDARNDAAKRLRLRLMGSRRPWSCGAWRRWRMMGSRCDARARRRN